MPRPDLAGLYRQSAREHARRAASHYLNWGATQAPIEAHERKVEARTTNQGEAAQQLSDTQVPGTWYYRALVGARSSHQAKMEVEAAMATMYATLASAYAADAARQP